MATTIRDKFVAFLNTKKTNPICERCGHNDWAIPEDDAVLMRLPIMEQGGSFSLPGPAIPALVMICNNCGNMRFHAAAIVDPALLAGR